MEKEFVPYEQALALKELGFDEPCFGYWRNEPQFKNPLTMCKHKTVDNSNDNHNFPNFHCLAPTFSQAFRWFRENRGLCIVIKPIDDKKLGLGYNLLKNGWIMSAHLSYEAAELGCLKGLIKLVKEK